MPRISRVCPLQQLRFNSILTLLIMAIAGNVAPAAPPRAAKAKSDAGATEVKLVRVPDRGIQPQAAVDPEGTLHLIYLGDEPGKANVYYVRKPAGSERFSKRIQVNSQSGSAIAIGSIRGAHLALGRANRVHVAWNGSGTAEPKGNV